VPFGARESSREVSDADGLITAAILLGFSFLILAISHGVRAAEISFGAAVPTAFILMAVTRIAAGDWELGFWRACTTALAALIAYLIITTAVGFCVKLFHTPAAHPEFSNQVAGAILQLRRLIPTTVAFAQTHYPVSVLATALLALHGPGLLFGALIIAAKIEEPYQDGIRGLLFAWSVSLIVMPMTVSTTYWLTWFTERLLLW